MGEERRGARRKLGHRANGEQCVTEERAGATAHEVSKVLRQAGARRIHALVVARPPAPGDPPAGPQ